MNATETEPKPTDTWSQQLEQLRARYKHIRQPILVALNILMHDQDIALDDAKAQAGQRGVKITAASVSAAKRLLSRMDDAPAAVTVVDRTPDGFTAIVQPRRPRAADAPPDAEALIRGVVAKIKGQGSVEAERLRDAMRKAVAVLQAAIG